MVFLGVDTSSSKGSVSLLTGSRIQDEITSESPASFSRSLLVMVDSLLTRSSMTAEDLSAIGVTVGPGSFTGIRIGLATAQGIALSRKTPVYGVSTLEAMACSSDVDDATVVPMLDAGMDNVYFAVFRKTHAGLERSGDDAAAPVGSLPCGAGGLFVLGDGAEKYRDRIGGSGQVAGYARMKESVSAGAARISRIKMESGEKGDMLLLKPNYIRRGQAAEANI